MYYFQCILKKKLDAWSDRIIFVIYNKKSPDYLIYFQNIQLKSMSEIYGHVRQ